MMRKIVQLNDLKEHYSKRSHKKRQKNINNP